jgi:hypothetical protein
MTGCLWGSTVETAVACAAADSPAIALSQRGGIRVTEASLIVRAHAAGPDGTAVRFCPWGMLMDSGRVAIGLREIHCE